MGGITEMFNKMFWALSCLGVLEWVGLVKLEVVESLEIICKLESVTGVCRHGGVFFLRLLKDSTRGEDFLYQW